MASNRQIEANRKNAKRSTGPRTAEGRKRASRNALRHGLSRRKSNLDPATEVVATAVASPAAFPPEWGALAVIARPKVELMRIRRVRYELLVAFLESPSLERMKRLKGIDRYERAALVEQRLLFDALWHLQIPGRSE